MHCFGLELFAVLGVSFVWFGLAATKKIFSSEMNSLRKDLLDFTALVYLFAFSMTNFPVLEQPRDSVLPRCTSMKLVLNFSRSGCVLTYGAWQQWSTHSAILALQRRRVDVSTSSLMIHSESGFSGNRDLIRSSEVYPPGFGLAVAAATDKKNSFSCVNARRLQMLCLNPPRV